MNKMAVLSKLTYRFNAILIKFPTGIFEETDKLMLKFVWKDKIQRIGKLISKKKDKAASLVLSGFKTYHTL